MQASGSSAAAADAGASAAGGDAGAQEDDVDELVGINGDGGPSTGFYSKEDEQLANQGGGASESEDAPVGIPEAEGGGVASGAAGAAPGRHPGGSGPEGAGLRGCAAAVSATACGTCQPGYVLAEAGECRQVRSSVPLA